MPSKFIMLLVAFLMTITPQITYAKSDDPGERIGTAIVAFLVILGFIALVNWLRSKKK
ncbi:MAG TPA: hypothetical protein VK498_09060 [Ferruginibacter sp.]|nr:hypothetical protein [Ferruginibacter sp.]